MLQSYEPKKYTVITKKLLLSQANEQATKGRRHTALEKIEEIRLEYLNILKIDCLWPLTNVVKLKLNNNVIEKIENLESLVNLCELDLSFNKITKIENLEALKNIHVLSFYDNEIEVVEGLDSMNSLTILSLGKNNIFDLDHVLYLRQFKELRSLQMAGNPCTERSGYKCYLMAFAPQLVYYGYKMITDKEREDANEKHRRALSNMQEAEMKKQKELETAELAHRKVEQQSASYVEYLDEDCLFLQMFIDDDEGRKLAELTQDTKVAYEQYRQTFSEICHQLYELGLKEELRRQDEVKALRSIVERVEAAVMKKARAIINSIQGKRLEITVRVTQMLREAAIAAEDADLDDDTIDEIDRLAKQLSRDFNIFLVNMRTKLMREETIVDEQIEEMIRMFKTNITDMVTSFLEPAQEYFTQLRNLETEYNDNIGPLVMSYLNSLEDEEKSPFLLSLLEDKDALQNCLATSHFMHLKVIDDRQDRMNNRLKEWNTKFVEKLFEQNTKMRRDRILEITHFLDYHIENSTVAKILGQQSSQMETKEGEEEEEEESVAETVEEAEKSEED
ncbi:dynein regulatory complex subunit 3-like [Phymastichus coffea]|uniref:dynein regulatory complex subunit 3-like n=1 Tax=Phymastichus coffea TaxID=108790 RepID=UPI00273B7FF0|nr:dynein regulatory complex subunit 3-like [Phymastichus coffea]